MTDRLIVKKATTDDLKLIKELEKSAVGKLYSTGTSSNDIVNYLKKETILLFYMNDKLIGKVSYINNVGLIQISGLVVLPKYRGYGYGKLISNYLVKIFPGSKRFELTVHPDNIWAINIYKELGFKQIKRIENYFGDNESRLLMGFINKSTKKRLREL